MTHRFATQKASDLHQLPSVNRSLSSLLLLDHKLSRLLFCQSKFLQSVMERAPGSARLDRHFFQSHALFELRFLQELLIFISRNGCLWRQCESCTENLLFCEFIISWGRCHYPALRLFC